MNPDQTFRLIMIFGAVILGPITLYYRIRSQATREKLDRRQEGWFILLSLRPIGVATMVGLIAYLIDPSSMAWSSWPLPVWVRWLGVGMGVVGGTLLVWTLRNLGKNLTDTVVTRRVHTLVMTGPYRWIRHPLYVTGGALLIAVGLMAANWFILGLSIIVVVLVRVVVVPLEEAALVARFGDDYRRYIQRTGGMLPRF